VNTHDDMIAGWKKDSTFSEEYDALEEQFTLFDTLLKARYEAGLTQADVAERMGTKTSAIARLEAGGGRQKHSPSLATLRKYAAAVGCRIEIKLVPVSQSPRPELGKPSTKKRRTPPNQGLEPTR
jgi:transcriptional regulator with XRE-family HTH domain